MANTPHAGWEVRSGSHTAIYGNLSGIALMENVNGTGGPDAAPQHPLEVSLPARGPGDPRMRAA
jgi:hypothetical protein